MKTIVYENKKLNREVHYNLVKSILNNQSACYGTSMGQRKVSNNSKIPNYPSIKVLL